MITPRPDTRRRDYRPGPLQSVTLTPDGKRWQLTFTRTFPHARHSVWNALTEPNEQLQWAPYVSDRSLTTPGPATLIMTDGTDRMEFDGTVGVADAPSLLEHAWGTDVLRWQLAETAAGTTLTLIQTVSERGSVAANAAGWHICLDVAERLLARDPVGRIVGADALDHGWRELNVHYADLLGVEPTEPPVE